MKKTLTVKIVPMDKVGYDAGEYCICALGNSHHIATVSSTCPDTWQAQQVLLVEDTTPKVGDVISDRMTGEVHGCTINDLSSSIPSGAKVIASHPNLPNTLPISPETLRAIVECGGECGGECTVKAEQYKSIAKGAKPGLAWRADPTGCIMVDVVRNEAVKCGLPIGISINDVAKQHANTYCQSHASKNRDGNWIGNHSNTYKTCETACITMFEDGANWQKNRQYTDEDMMCAFVDGKNYGKKNPIMAEEWLTDYKQSKQTT